MTHTGKKTGKSPGLTVIEALVAAGLTAVVLSLAASAMIQTMRHHRRLAVATELLNINYEHGLRVHFDRALEGTPLDGNTVWVLEDET